MNLALYVVTKTKCWDFKLTGQNLEGWEYSQLNCYSPSQLAEER